MIILLSCLLALPGVLPGVLLPSPSVPSSQSRNHSHAPLPPAPVLALFALFPCPCPCPCPGARRGVARPRGRRELASRHWGDTQMTVPSRGRIRRECGAWQECGQMTGDAGAGRRGTGVHDSSSPRASSVRCKARSSMRAALMRA